MKDNFSAQANLYAQFRPSYPDTLLRHIYQMLNGKDCAWDCATGNGQMAACLAEEFTSVYATDISEAQLSQAILKHNIHYSIQPAESTHFSEKQLDLITVAQAVHWFDFAAFYAEVNRTLKDDGLFIIAGYGLLSISAAIDVIIHEFYTQTIGQYWDAERRFLDQHYQTIPFPFEEIPFPAFDITDDWDLEQLMGYLNTWSAVQHYIRKNGTNPVDLIKPKLEAIWQKNTVKEVRFPVLIRAGRKLKMP